MFCCTGLVGTWNYPGGDHQYIYGSNAHSARIYLDGFGQDGRTYIPTVTNANDTTGQWQTILDCTVLNEGNPCVADFDIPSFGWNDYVFSLVDYLGSDYEGDQGWWDENDIYHPAPGEPLAITDCTPAYSFAQGNAMNPTDSTQYVNFDVYAIHGPGGVTGWRLGSIVNGEYRLFSPIISVVGLIENLEETNYNYGTKEKKILFAFLCNHYSLMQFLRYYQYQWIYLPYPRCIIDPDLIGAPSPCMTFDGVGIVISMTIQSLANSDVMLSGSISSQCDSWQSYKSLPSPQPFRFCLETSDPDTTPRYYLARHKKGFAEQAALTILIVAADSYGESESLVFEIDTAGNAHEGSSLETIMCIAESKSQATIYEVPGYHGIYCPTGGFPIEGTNATAVLGGAYETGYALMYGVSIPSFNPIYACAMPGYASGLLCKFGSFTATSAGGKYVHFFGWQVDIPELNSDTWELGAKNIPREPMTDGRWNNLFCCKDMMAVLAVTGINGTVWNEDYGDEKLTVWDVTVGIWISIKGNSPIYYEGRTFAYEYVNINANPVRKYSIDAGVDVSCGCGLNIYWASIGNDSWHEVYEGTTKTDYTWAICCGDNHLLVGKGVHGWEPVINIDAQNLMNSTCTLDDGTICTITDLQAEYQYPQPNPDINEAMLDILELITDGLRQGFISQPQFTAVSLYVTAGGWNITHVFMFFDGTITAQQLMDSIDGTFTPPPNPANYRIASWKFTDSSGKERVFSNGEYIPFKYAKSSDYKVLARTRTKVEDNVEGFVEDDTLYDVTCWANQYGGEEASAVYVKGLGNNSRDGAFITFGAQGAKHERIVRMTVDQSTGEVIKETLENEVKDNHKFYTGHRLKGPINRIESLQEPYRFKALERNHKRQGIYAKMKGETRTENPDFDANGDLQEGVVLDFDHVAGGNHPNANLRLFVDDKESWYRYDRLPEVSDVDEEPVGIHWNHPDAALHRTTVWSGNGQLYIEHV